MNNKNTKIDGTCIEMALEGERLCRIGECELGVQYLESAVSMGTKDLKALSAIYSQLGNAYFILQNYSMSMDYHNKDLNLSRSVGDRQEEAKASGNLGNTFKSLGKFDEAFTCCQRHLDISRELNDQSNEAKALYNLGSVFHTKGKQLGRSQQKDPGSYPQESRDLLEIAISYYETNLTLVRELGDKASVGRTCGNLGNTHYLLGNFKKAIIYHEERLQLAEMFGDLSAERRAYNNLGNAYMLLGDFRKATQLYRKTLDLAVRMKDLTLEAQALYSLGNTYNLLCDYPAATENHLRHLSIARQLHDRVGEGKACWSLSNVYAKIHSGAQALEFARQHLVICKEVEDQKGYAMAQVNLCELKELVNVWEDASGFKRANSCREKGDEEGTESCGSRRRSMENLNLLTPDKAPSRFQFKAPDISLWKRQVKGIKTESNGKKYKGIKKQSSIDSDEGTFFDLLSKYQSRRLDDQRCSSNVLSRTASCVRGGNEDDDDKENQAVECGRGGAVGGLEDDFLDMLVGIQGSRMDDQRSQLPLSLGARCHVRGAVNRSSPSHSTGGMSVASVGTTSSNDEQFFEMIMRCQGERLDSQRSVMPGTPSDFQRAPTVPDEDFLNLIQRFQCSRLEEQRSHLPCTTQILNTTPDLLKH